MNKQAWLNLMPVLLGLGLVCCGNGYAQFENTGPTTNSPIASSNLRALIDKGIYWYDRYRFDLASQQFNRALLIDPRNASALRWQGLNDLARGEVQAADIWLKRLQNLHGSHHPFAIELAQNLQLITNKRQRFAELKFLADSEQRPANLTTQLKQLFEQAPLGEAAVQVYRLMARTSEGRALARAQVQQLIDRHPDDKRYRRLLAELGSPTEEQVTQISNTRKGNKTERTTQAKTNNPTNSPKQDSPQTAIAAPAENLTPSNPELNTFEQGEQLSKQAQTFLAAQDLATTEKLLNQAIDLNPAYPWFRYDLAIALNDTNIPANRQKALTVMREGLAINDDPEMHFAQALILARLGNNSAALEQMQEVQRKNWTEGMFALEKRILYGQYLSNLQTANAAGNYNILAKQLQEPTPWRQEPEVQNLRTELNKRLEANIEVAYENATIDGSTGISKIQSQEAPIQINLPLDYERTGFVRLDTLIANAGRIDPSSANNFGQLGTTPTPGTINQFLDQKYTGQVLGAGVNHPTWRWDLGSTAGNFPVNSWVGGLQWRTQLGAGSLRLDLARRMVTGSVLSTTGAIDPLSGERWGGARRNGLTAVYFQSITPTLDVVGIGRANLITGRNIPDNTELNAQGILSKTLYQKAGQNLELGASLFLWSFDKNLRFYTFGQGGYYSPQAFASFTIPVTWTGSTQQWSWRVLLRLGASESREDATNLYPLNPNLAASAAALGNSTQDSGGPGGGTSTGLRAQIEHLLAPNLSLGGLLEIDRSEGFNPDRLQVYMRYQFGSATKLNRPPEGLTPYSKF